MRALSAWLCIVMGLVVTATGGGQTTTDQTTAAKDLLRSGQAKYDWSTPVTLVVANEKNGTSQKWIRGRLKGVPAGLAFRPAQTVEEARAIPTPQAAHLYVGDDHWMVSSAKKMALRLDFDKGLFAAALTAEEMRARSPDCAVDFFEDPEVSHSLSTVEEQGTSYRVVTRRFTGNFLKRIAACNISPLGAVNSEFLPLPARSGGKGIYPVSVEYFIDDAGYIRIWRSYSASGELLTERKVLHVAPYEGNASPLFSIPKDYTVEIVKNTADFKRALKKLAAK